jgi:ribosome maturation factor RimP
MTFKDRVTELVVTALETRKDLFLIEYTVTPDQKIKVFIDGDKGVQLQDCIDISRHIEHQLDREEYDFSLEVASAGVGSNLKKVRQYQNNIGRKLRVEIEGVKPLEGTLVKADENAFTLMWKQREPKPIGKGKITVTKEETLSYDAIASAIVLV